ncbi:MAG: GspH/FimT family pseudopilin [Pseudomonadota bacterium]|nr:GspH/FimT family pseudopilin [Pseudomonadota bacterium]
MLSASYQRGFTIVELLIGITLLGVLLGIGAPMMGTYLQNSKLANAAATYFAGIQTARTEAIRRNVRTEFVLTDTPVSTGDLANALALTTAGPNWVVRAASGPGAFRMVEAKAGAEGDAASGVAAVQVLGSASAPAVFDGRIPFNGFGGTADNASYAIDISNPAAGTCVLLGGTIRCRRITVSPGGQINSCDPAAPAGDSRAC